MMDTPMTLATPTERSMPLACQRCSSRKIKCDHKLPCRQCVRRGEDCVPGVRKPRRRHAVKQDIGLLEARDRITKLEVLLDGLSRTREPYQNLRKESTAGLSSQEDDPMQESYEAATFGSASTAEDSPLKDICKEFNDERSPDSHSAGRLVGGFDLLICAPGVVGVMPDALFEPPADIKPILFQIFLQKVSPILPLCHIPSLRDLFENGQPYLGTHQHAPAIKALHGAIWYLTTSTLSETESQRIFQQSKIEVLSQLKRTADVLLLGSELLNSSSLVNLQALVVYLLASRMNDTGQRSWALSALAVRIARGMRLHQERPGLDPYKKEVRRRTWHQIRVLDAYIAGDKGWETMILTHSFSTSLPSNADDEEFDKHSATVPDHTDRLTDMSFCLLTCDAMTVIQRLTTPDAVNERDTWQLRLDIATEFGTRVENKYLRHCDLSVPFHRLIYAVGKSMKASMVLRAIRPMQRHVLIIPPRTNSPYVLQTAVHALREDNNIHVDPDCERWRWLVWLPWHALVVALAGLCSIRSTPLAAEAWIYAQKAYERCEHRVADTGDASLLDPVRRLYQKAKAFRDQAERDSPRLSAEHPEVAGQQSRQKDNMAEFSSPQYSTKTYEHYAQPLCPNQQYHGVDFTEQWGFLHPGTVSFDHRYLAAPTAPTSTTESPGLLDLSSPPNDLVLKEWTESIDNLSNVPLDSVASR